tara:strand:+ start:547 stop:783 length:237 start_codon:yes stop_codon:yes gene_type:complete
MEDKIETEEFPLFDTRLLRADLLLCYLDNAQVALMKQSKALYDNADFSGSIIRQAHAQAFNLLITKITRDEFTFEDFN